MENLFKDIKVNAYQTPLTEEFLSQYPEEVQEQAFEFITSIEFIKRLISPNRKTAKECPRDETGKIIVDLTNPHIVEDTDYFRPAALHYIKHGCYTFLKPNSNPHSDYRKFWAEEIRRCREGYVRPSDGEWVTGFCYWFLNYNPMLVNVVEKGKKKAIRKESFPYFFEGIYWRFHYLWQAREAGEHAIELAKRGAHPYYQKVNTPEGKKKWGDIQIGDKLYNTQGGICTVTGIPIDREDTNIFLVVTRNDTVQATADHLWNVIIKDAQGGAYVRTLETWQLYKIHKTFKGRFRIYLPSITTPRGKVREPQFIKRIVLERHKVPVKVKCVTVDSEDHCYLIGNNIPTHNCGKAHPYDANIFTPEGWKKWGNLQIGDCVYGDDGFPTKIINIPFDNICPIYRITLRDGRQVEASNEHLWKVRNINKNRHNTYIMTTKDMLTQYKSSEGMCRLFIPKHEGIELSYKDIPIDAYTLGLLLGDGCFRHKSCYYTQLEEDMQEEAPFIPYSIIKWKTQYGWRICIEEYSKKIKNLGLYGIKSENKFIPEQYLYNSKEVRLNLLKGLMDTDGWATKGRAPAISISSKQLAQNILQLARSLGYNCNCIIKKAGYKKDGIYKEGHPAYVVTIYGGKELFNLPRKQRAVSYNLNTSRKQWTSITKIEYLGNKKAKCITVDNASHCYLIEDFIVTHNSYTLSSIMTHNLLLGESEESKKRVTTVLTAYQKEYLKDDKDGTLSKFRPSLAFIQTNTPFPRLMLKDSPNEMSWQMGYKDEYGRPQGSFNTVLGVSAKDDSGKLRGKRGWILYEEMGQFKNLLALYDVTRKSVEDGDYTFAIQYLVGTASDNESDFSAAKTLLTSPEGYKIYALDNVFDKPKQGSPKFGFFFGGYINRAGCYNKDGVSDVIKALFQILMNRYKAKYNSADPQSVLRAIAEEPITPAEAIIKVKAAYFPVAQINERILEIDSNPRFYDDALVGDLVLKDGKVSFTPTDDEVITKWNVDNSTVGALQIFEMPKTDSEGKIPQNRYILGADPKVHWGLFQ